MGKFKKIGGGEFEVFQEEATDWGAIFSGTFIVVAIFVLVFWLV